MKWCIVLHEPPTHCSVVERDSPNVYAWNYQSTLLENAENTDDFDEKVAASFLQHCLNVFKNNSSWLAFNSWFFKLVVKWRKKSWIHRKWQILLVFSTKSKMLVYFVESRRLMFNVIKTLYKMSLLHLINSYVMRQFPLHQLKTHQHYVSIESLTR